MWPRSPHVSRLPAVQDRLMAQSVVTRRHDRLSYAEGMVQLLVLEVDDRRWMRFVEAQPGATPFHHPLWAQLLADCYGMRPFAVGVEADGELAAGLPFLEVRNLTGVRHWVALPFTDMVAPLGSSSGLSELGAALERRLAEEDIRSVEIRSDVGWGGASNRGYSHVLSLGPDPEELLQTFSKTRVRQEIARAARDGVQIRVGERSEDLVSTFYWLHLHTRRRLGVPVQPRRFFSLLWQRFISQGLGTVLVAEHGGRPIASGVFLGWNGTLVYKFGASDRGARAGANHAILWEAIRRACEAGMRELDFGRTDSGNEGLRAFKAGWGTDERALVYTAIGDTRDSADPRVLGSTLSFVIRHSPPWICRAAGEMLYRYAA